MTALDILLALISLTLLLSLTWVCVRGVDFPEIWLEKGRTHTQYFVFVSVVLDLLQVFQCTVLCLWEKGGSMAHMFWCQLEHKVPWHSRLSLLQPGVTTSWSGSQVNKGQQPLQEQAVALEHDGKCGPIGEEGVGWGVGVWSCKMPWHQNHLDSLRSSRHSQPPCHTQNFHQGWRTKDLQ